MCSRNKGTKAKIFPWWRPFVHGHGSAGQLVEWFNRIPVREKLSFSKSEERELIQHNKYKT